ncbi:MAG: hypothetical protein ACRCV5_08820 [Afipia sp.]
MDTIVTKTVHLERTSEADSVPVEWARGELARVLKALPQDEQSTAMLVGWRGLSVQYRHRRTDLEVAQDRLALLLQGLRTGAASGMTREQIEALIAQVS